MSDSIIERKTPFSDSVQSQDWFLNDPRGDTLTYELAKHFTPLGLFCLHAKEAVNQNLPKVVQERARLEADSDVSLAAIQKIYEKGSLTLEQFGRAMGDERVRQERVSLVENLRRNGKPELRAAIEALYPQTSVTHS